MQEFVKAVKIIDNVYWVGAIDWGIRDFHGYATRRGTNYNAYLIMADKITLIDCVKGPFMEEMLARIRSVIEPEKIDYIISNHAEMDHSGALPDIIKIIKPEKIFASKLGERALNDHFHIDMNITSVVTGDELDIGNRTLSFIETRMLHWPDSMFTFLKEDGLLFSQDAFGMHLATNKLFVKDNLINIVEWETAKYYANILLPYAQKVLNLFDKMSEMNLDIKMIAPDHGPIWHDDNINHVFELYKTWSIQKPTPKAIVVYDTMWNSTEVMAKAIADGLQASGITVNVTPLSASDRSDVATEVLDAGAIIVGSPTLNNNLFPTMADVMIYLRGLKPKNMIGAVFGSYGWSGEATKQLEEELDYLKIERVAETISVRYVPRIEDLEKCYEQGVQVGKALLKKIKEFK